MSIKISELRIGNLVSCNGELQNVFSLQDGRTGIFINNTGIYHFKYEPIPLSSDILLTCGFTCGEYHKRDWYHTKLSPLVHQYDDCFELQTTDAVIISAPFQYLHQLQNLYHALTGEELQIKDLNVAVSDTTGAK